MAIQARMDILVSHAVASGVAERWITHVASARLPLHVETKIRFSRFA
jgi:hypothetical protein